MGQAETRASVGAASDVEWEPFVQSARERALGFLMALQLFVVAVFGLADGYVADPGSRRLLFGGLVVGLLLSTGMGMFFVRPLIHGSAERFQKLEKGKREQAREAREYVDAVEEYAHELEQANDDLRRFAQIASHDLKEPVRMVSSYVQLLQERYGDELDEDAEEYMEFAVEGAHRLDRLIEGLLSYTETGHRQPGFEQVDLGTVLDDAMANLGQRLEASDATVYRDDLPMVYGDHAQLVQIFQNLLGNAIKFAGDEPPQIHVSAREEDDEWVVTVSDQGVGFDADSQGRIFEIFQTGGAESSGTGIGLAICKRIVDRHRGEIWAESDPGEGATFRFTLPTAEHQEAAPTSIDPPETLEERTERVI